MKRLACGLGLLTFVGLLAACNSSGNGTAANGNGQDGSGQSASGANEPTQKTVEEKLVGEWLAIVSFSNEAYSAARESLPDDDARDKLDAQVEERMGTTLNFEFTADGKVKTNMPVDGENETIEGTWAISNGTTETGTLTLKFTVDGESIERNSEIEFEGEDEFTASYDPLPNPKAEGVFHLELTRQK